MIEEIITKQYKTKDSKLFDTKEEAEKYEEVLEFFNWVKTIDTICLECKSKDCSFTEDRELVNCDKDQGFGPMIVRILMDNYSDLKMYFDVDDLQKQIKYLTEQNIIYFKANRELEDEVESLR